MQSQGREPSAYFGDAHADRLRQWWQELHHRAEQQTYGKGVAIPNPTVLALVADGATSGPSTRQGSQTQPPLTASRSWGEPTRMRPEDENVRTGETSGSAEPELQGRCRSRRNPNRALRRRTPY